LNKRWILLITLVVTLAILATPVVGAQRLIVTHEMSPDPAEPTHAFFVVLKSYIERNSDFQVEIFPANVLGGMRETVEQTREGVIHIAQLSIGGCSLFWRPMLLFNTPYAYASDKAAAAFWNSGHPFMEHMYEEFENRAGVKPLTMIERGGFTILTNNVRPVRTPEDMRGIQFRAMDSSQIALYRALGGDGIPVPWEEVYTALQTGVVQGQTNPISITLDARFDEVQKYATMPGAIAGSGLVVANPDWYYSLSDADRRVIDEAVYYARITAAGATQMSQATGVEDLAKRGFEVTVQTPEEYEVFRTRGLEGVLDWARNEFGAELTDWFVEAVREVEAELE